MNSLIKNSLRDQIQFFRRDAFAFCFLYFVFFEARALLLKEQYIISKTHFKVPET